MNYYSVEVEFLDGTIVNIEVYAENEDEAIQKAMPIRLQIED